MSAPKRWNELSPGQKKMVERYIETLLATQVDLFGGPVVKKGREIVRQIVRNGISYQLEKVKCGKDCMGCPHGPYWYAYWRNPHGKVVSRYIGKEFKRLDNKRLDNT